MARDVLLPSGFDCYTVGRNVSAPDQVDDVIRRELELSHCLIGVATRRFVATDLMSPNRTLIQATQYLLQETSAAHQIRLPFLIFKTPDVTLPGVTARNLYIEIEPTLSAQGRVIFKVSEQLVVSALRDLMRRAQEVQRARGKALTTNRVKTTAAWVLAGVGALKALGWASRPSCYSEFYYKNPDCKNCPWRSDCKAEKTRRGG